MSNTQGEICDVILPQDVWDAYVNTRETTITPDENASDAATAGHQSADGQEDRVTVAVTIPREPCVQHLHIIGKPGTGKAVPMLLPIGRSSNGHLLDVSANRSNATP